MSIIHILWTLTDIMIEVTKCNLGWNRILGAGRLRFITQIREAYRVLFNISVQLNLRY